MTVPAPTLTPEELTLARAAWAAGRTGTVVASQVADQLAPVAARVAAYALARAYDHDDEAEPRPLGKHPDGGREGWDDYVVANGEADVTSLAAWWEQLAQREIPKNTGPFWVPGHTNTGRRLDRDCLSVGWMVVDADDVGTSDALENALSLHGAAFARGNSPNHCPKGCRSHRGGVTKWRLALPLRAAWVPFHAVLGHADEGFQRELTRSRRWWKQGLYPAARWVLSVVGELAREGADPSTSDFLNRFYPCTPTTGHGKVARDIVSRVGLGFDLEACHQALVDLGVAEPLEKVHAEYEARAATSGGAWTPADGDHPMVAAFKASGRYIAPLEGGKHAVTCPWEDTHSPGDWPESDTVLMEGKTLSCKHRHPEGKGPGAEKAIIDKLGPDAEKAWKVAWAKVHAADRARRGEGSKRPKSAAPKTERAPVATPAEKRHPRRDRPLFPLVDLPSYAGAWYVALRAAERLGPALEDGKHAILCINNAAHTTPPPDASAAEAGGSCVLIPPGEGQRLGLPRCSHQECQGLTLKDWILAVGTEVWEDALLEIQGWRRAGSYLVHDRGIGHWVRKPFPLPTNGGDPEHFEDSGDEERAEEGAPTMVVPSGNLCDFPCRIMQEVEEHGPTGTRRYYQIEGERGGRPFSIRVPAGDFASLGWVPNELGAEAVIEPGRDTKDKLRAAIQVLSKPIPRKDVFGITGWRKVAGRWVYLHAGGAIGADGAAAGIEVNLESGALARFVLPAPLEGEALRQGVIACASLFRVGRPEVSMPFFGAIWRSALGPTGLTVHLSAPPKTGKTMYAALGQQHFGPAMDERHLPASWKQATAASLNFMRGVIGDAPFVVDDFLITGTAEDVRLSEKADAVMRAQFNGSGAARLNRDGTLARSEAPPRSMLISTGEVLPRGHSLRSRLLVLELPEQIKEDLGPRKALARSGLYAATMASFLRWLAPRYEAVRGGLEEEALKIAERLACERDRRTASLVAEVLLGVKYFLAFARESGLPAEEADGIRRDAWSALQPMGEVQQVQQERQDPAPRFVQLLENIITSGRAHLTKTDGTAPEDCHLWGWRIRSNFAPLKAGKYSDRSEEEEREPMFSPSGVHLGFVSGDRVWLNADVALAEARKLATETNDPLPVTREDLGKRLHDKGLLADNELKTRNTYTVRKKLRGTVVSGFLCMGVDVLRGGGSGEASGERAVSEPFDTDKLN